MIALRCGSAFAETSHATYYTGDIVGKCSIIAVVQASCPVVVLYKFFLTNWLLI
jgi:hypothetical protein